MLALIILTVNCGSPRVQKNDSGSIIVMGYTDNPVFQRTEVTFSCPPGFTLLGANLSICQDSGQWEPDPRKMHCKGLSDKTYYPYFNT